jgi:hypothetical protein
MLHYKVQSEIALNKIIKSNLFPGIRVDYYVPDFNLIVEVNGIQHYEPSSFGRDSVDTILTFVKQLTRDDRLRNACVSKGVSIIEIPYTWSFNEILIKLTEYKDAYNRC